MPYDINFTNRNEQPITVFDNTSNTETSLTFPGRNVKGYGQAIAENFLHLLENFSNTEEPSNPVTGQIWYNSDPAVSSLMVWDGVSWKSASGVHKSPSKPSVNQAKVGELWVDTINKRLYVYGGADQWIPIGPSYSSGLQTGLVVEQLKDADDIDRTVLSMYVEDRPVLIISKDSFTPKITIPQFPKVKAGITLANPSSSTTAESEIYQGGLLPKLYGTASAADSLVINDTVVESGKFLRSDTFNTLSQQLAVRNNAGITVGADANFNISTSTNSVKLFNSIDGSAIDLQVKASGFPQTVVRVVAGKVGINTSTPSETLDVAGDTKFRGKVNITDTSTVADPTTFSAGNYAVSIAGGVAVQKNVFLGDKLVVKSETTLSNTYPAQTDSSTLGSSARRWKSIHAKTIYAETIEGVLAGSITGNSNSATQLQQTTTFKMEGDVVSPSFQFNGIIGGSEKVFSTTISSSFVSSKPDIKSLLAEDKPYSTNSDFVLVSRSGTGTLYKASRDVFVGDLGVPVGAILPYAGAVVPEGYLLCDGSEVIAAKYPELYQAIGTLYNGSGILGSGTFRLPDLRGRFALGRDNMDNGQQVQLADGNYIDAGGGNADRVGGIDADTLGGAGGDDEYSLSLANLPDHEHTLRGSSGQQYYAVRVDTSIPVDNGAVLSIGGTTTNQAQHLPSSGPVKTGSSLNRPYPVMNPFLTVNYIIRAGRAAF